MTKTGRKRGMGIGAASVFAIAFGLLTIKSGGAVLFGDDAARVAAGSYVPFVLWFNFIAGFAYVIAGTGLWLLQRWAFWLAAGIATATLITFAILGLHIYAGTAYELRTVLAMSLRTVVWLIISGVAFRALR